MGQMDEMRGISHYFHIRPIGNTLLEPMWHVNYIHPDSPSSEGFCWSNTNSETRLITSRDWYYRPVKIPESCWSDAGWIKFITKWHNKRIISFIKYIVNRGSQLTPNMISERIVFSQKHLGSTRLNTKFESEIGSQAPKLTKAANNLPIERREQKCEQQIKRICDEPKDRMAAL